MNERCFNHPDKMALSFCHSCGKYFCGSCLDEGEEFFYCYDEKCQTAKSEDEAETISTQNKIEQKVADQTLSSRQRRLFTIFPGLAVWYSCFATAELKQRKKEAFRCQLIGSRNYLLVGLICLIGINIFTNTPASSDEILLILVLLFMLSGISIYLFLKKISKTQRKDNDDYRRTF